MVKGQMDQHSTDTDLTWGRHQSARHCDNEGSGKARIQRSTRQTLWCQKFYSLDGHGHNLQ